MRTALLAIAPAPTAARPPDALSLALARMGLTEADLGYRPEAHWTRYLHPATTPNVCLDPWRTRGSEVAK